MKWLSTLRETHETTPEDATFMNWAETYMLSMHSSELGQWFRLQVWLTLHIAKYHRGRLFTDTQQEYLDHCERVKQLIPPSNLLIYEVGEGWDRLAEFLGVYVHSGALVHYTFHLIFLLLLCNSQVPAVPFPHVNDTAQFWEFWGSYSGPKNERLWCCKLSFDFS